MHEKILKHYETLKELLINNETNLLKNVVKHYLRIFVIKHRNTISYHSKTNERIENLNEILNNILIKYLTKKSTKLWNEFLFQTLSAIRVKIHATSKYNLFFSLYDRHSILFFDDSSVKSIEVTNSTKKHEARITKLQHVRLTANKKLLVDIIYANKIRDIRLNSHVSIKTKHWMLMRHEKKQKFETKCYDFYKILNDHFLKTYRLTSSNDKVLKNLFNDNKFAKTNVINNDLKIWFSSVKQAELRKQNKIV